MPFHESEKYKVEKITAHLRAPVLSGQEMRYVKHTKIYGLSQGLTRRKVRRQKSYL